MSRSILSQIGPRRLVAVLVSTCALAAGGALALTGTASASGTPATPHFHACSDATLNGTYTYAYGGSLVTSGVSAPVATSGFDRFNGAGTSKGLTTFVDNGVVENNNTPDTSAYKVHHNCTGTIVFNIAGSIAHFNIYLSPSGRSFSIIETDPGSVETGTETRVS
jgi:hypothetical protein